MSSGRREPVAHSPPRHDSTRQPQPYRLHVEAVREGARRRAACALAHAAPSRRDLLGALVSAAVFHDLGKLDEENQGPLSIGRDKSLRWDHVDAGVAHLLGAGNEAGAWLVRAHHAPGLPCLGKEDALPRKLRGGRNRDPDEGEHGPLISRVDTSLPAYVATHESACGHHPIPAAAAQPLHGLPMRLALSCLVDADHTDSASYDAGVSTPMPCDDRVAPRWHERLARLEETVARKAREATAHGRGERVRDRGDFFRACLGAPVSEPLATCGGPVGIGKTLAVTANLVRRAADEQLRHIFIVAPYTNIITQAVKELRAALVLAGENPEEVVAEHHHRADFSSPENRELATLWRAPVIVTTAVQFFETLASNVPARLRKLHELPGSAVFLDEAHAALPARLWPQNWRWMVELAEDWGCRFIFASGSLARFWTLDRIVERRVELQDLLGATAEGRDLQSRLVKREGDRVRYECLGEGITVDRLCKSIRSAKGPRLLILNTVQSAAVVASRLRRDGADVLHVSTALCPRDRDRILRRVRARLRLEHMAARCGTERAELDRIRNWTLVATSCVEAGIDLSFQTAFRERASAASLIQVGGRVNRHRERGGGIVYDFTFDPREPEITRNPDWDHARSVLQEMLDGDLVNGHDPADVVTDAIRFELQDLARFAQTLTNAERNRDYPLVAKDGRVIDDDTVLVVVDEELCERLRNREKVDVTTLLRLTVQLRKHRVQSLGLAEIPNRREIYAWGGRYDPLFLGVMDDILTQKQFEAHGGEVV
jgi:CRISPR-associated endonuclease/helicase Cas3